MTGRANTKLAWVVGAAVVWAWAGLYLALGAPEGDPVFELQLAEGKGGVMLKGRLAELIEDGEGIQLTMDYPARAGEEWKAPETPKLPDGITVKYLPPTDRPTPPRIEVQNGLGPVRLPSRAVLVAARDYIFKIDREGVRILEAPAGSPLRRKLEKMEEYRHRHPEMQERMERREDRRGKLRERFEERGGKRRGMGGPEGEGRGPGGPPPEDGRGDGGLKGPPPGEGQGQPPEGGDQGGGNPPPPEEGR
jgi:hypothetical protein